MTIINLYIVTFKNVTLNINVINNHSEFIINEKFKNINVMHNTLRPDFSTGHLSRSWNQAIMHGFRSLRNPIAQIVVACQVDSIFSGDWLTRLLDLHQRYSFVSAGHGDAFLSFTPDGVKAIGLFDERFCNIIHQECDYFNRALIFNKDKSSINDFWHGGRVLNPFLIDANDHSFIYKKNHDVKVTWNSTVECHEHITKFLLSKYARDPRVWDIGNPPRLLKKLMMFYPYFEFDVSDFNSKYEVY
jgi:hypothetical protein